MTTPTLIQTTPHSRPYRLYTIEHVPFDAFPRYADGGPAMVLASREWSKSTSSTSLLFSSPSIAEAAAADPLPFTLNLRYRGAPHALDGTKYPTQQAADQAAYEVGATAFMVYERPTCVHCGARIYRRDTPLGGRYRFTDRADGTDILGSGCECPNNERGHEAAS